MFFSLCASTFSLSLVSFTTSTVSVGGTVSVIFFDLSTISLDYFFVSRDSSNVADPEYLLRDPVSFYSKGCPAAFARDSFSVENFVVSW